MASADQHRQRAEQNRRFLSTVDIDAFPEWAATVAFYTASHEVERLRRATGDGSSAGHGERLAYLERRHPAIHPAFRRLHDASQIARYKSVGEFFTDNTAESVQDGLIGHDLPAVEGYVGRVLAGASS